MDRPDPHPPRRLHGHGLLIRARAAALTALACGPMVAPSAAHARPQATVTAVVSEDLRRVTGTLTWRGFDGDPVSALAQLPQPADDLTAMRTWPGRPSHGVTHLSRIDAETWAFETELPRRYGAVGATWRGLFANGWWLPVVDAADALPVVDWTVTVDVPDDTLAVVGDQWGASRVTWSGSADRVSLAVLPGATATAIGALTVVARGRPRRRVVREVTDILATLTPSPVGVVAVAPLRRRLTRAGAGTLYLSDRAFRLTPPLQRYHRVAVARGLSEALSPLTDSLDRAITAEATAAHYTASVRGPGARRLLGWFSWVPTFDAILYDRTLPFHSDVLDATFSSDPVQDTLSEVFVSRWPGTAVYRQTADLLGEDAAQRLAAGLRDGLALPDAAIRAGVPATLSDGWRHAYPAQDYTLRVRHDEAMIRREATEGAPAEVMQVRHDDTVESVLFGPGPGEITVAHGAGGVALDPKRHVSQSSRAGDAWPTRFRISGTGGVGSINLSEGWLSAGVALIGRPAGDNRKTMMLHAATSRDTWVTTGLAYTRRFGPEISGLSRRHRITTSASVALQNQRFADTNDRPLTLSGALTWSWSSRQGGWFPLRGWRLFASGGGGVAPATSETWISARASAVHLIPLHPRLVIASRASVGAARSDVRGRLLSLGGPGAVRGLPYGDSFGTLRAIAAFEVRAVPIRDASVPLLMAWGRELEVTAGLEVGALQTVDDVHRVVSATFGVAGVADVLGAQPRLAGITVALPLAAAPGVTMGAPQVYLRWGQEF